MTTAPNLDKPVFITLPLRDVAMLAASLSYVHERTLDDDVTRLQAILQRYADNAMIVASLETLEAGNGG